jgi:Flp pilus assembly protein TadG
MARRHEVRGQPRGQALVTMAVSLVAILGFLGLAIDVGMMMLARNELQNAADAAALAGANAMYKRNDGTYEPFPNWNRARDSSTNAVPYNQAMRQALATGTITTGWWNITGTPAGMQPTTKATILSSDAAAVRVQIKKAPGTNGGPITLFLAPMVGVQTEAIQASAVAVVSYPGSVSEGELYPTAMSGCLFRTFWDVTTNSPKIDPLTHAPYEFLIGSSYHYDGCESGQWTSFNLGTQSAQDMKLLIRDGNGGPLSIGDTIYVQDGTETSGYVESIKDGLIGQDILVPVTESLEGGTWQQIIGFGAFHIDDIVGGSSKYIQGHFTAGLIVPIAGPGGPSWGALIPPTLVQ